MPDPAADEPEDDASGPLGSVEAEIRQMLGLFDAPSFARRGQDLDDALARLHGRCERARSAMLEMVHLRLRQWAAVATGPGDGEEIFLDPIAPLWDVSGAPTPERWADPDRPASPRRRRQAARELSSSVERFNRRWSRFVDELDLGPVNRRVEAYNRYYLLEKECALGSQRLASRLFRPVEPITVAVLLDRHPLLPTPQLRPPR